MMKDIYTVILIAKWVTCVVVCAWWVCCLWVCDLVMLQFSDGIWEDAHGDNYLWCVWLYVLNIQMSAMGLRRVLADMRIQKSNVRTTPGTGNHPPGTGNHPPGTGNHQQGTGNHELYYNKNTYTGKKKHDIMCTYQYKYSDMDM